MNAKYERQLKKGVFEILVLKLLSEGEKYGYELLLELKERGGELFAVKEGTLYPILYRLEDDGLASSRWSRPEGREVSRKYYSITPKGKEELEELKELWKSFEKGVSGILEEEL